MNQVDKLIKYKAVFSSPDGKVVLDDLFSTCHMMRPTLSKTPDPYEMAYREGQRSVVLRILHFLESDVESIRERMSRIHKEAESYD